MSELTVEEVVQAGSVSTSWLAAHLGDPNVRIVDASWHLGAMRAPPMSRNATAEFESEHIPGAVYWDIDALSREDERPHMINDNPRAFAESMEMLEIVDCTLVVLYDTGALFTCARPWWELRYYSHDKVVLLDGGMKKWKAEGRPLEAGVIRPPSTKGCSSSFTAVPRPEMVRSYDQVLRNIDSRDEQVVDARSAGRFHATQPEPRPGCPGGHVPGSLNVPCGIVLAADGTLLPPDELRRCFEDAGVNLSKPVVLSCGSGVTASALCFCLYVLGKRDQVAVYDGSWAEWGMRPDSPIAK